MSTKKVKKRRLLLDEGLPPRTRFPKINNYHIVRHILHDLKLLGEKKLKDPEIYDYAKKNGMIPVVFNEKDFVKCLSSNGPSIICVPMSMKYEDIDIKIFSLLSGKNP